MRSMPYLARWLAAIVATTLCTAAGAAGTIDYEVRILPRKPGAFTKPSPKYQFLFADGATWPGPIRWYYNHSGAPASFAGDPAGTLAKIRATLDSWTQVCGVTYAYQGETAIAPNTLVGPPGFERPDGVNVVGWGTLDPGTAGVAHVWHDPEEFFVLAESDITLSPTLVTSDSDISRTVTHEWGHAIGLAHSDFEGTLMSGPPLTTYNQLNQMQRDDILGCRCMYGGSAVNPAGFTCTLPDRLEFGAVPVGGASTPRTVAVTNHGNGPLTINSVAINSLRVTRDGGCPAGTVLAPGKTCTVALVARPPLVFSYTDTLTFNTSDGPYRVQLAYAGTADATVPQVVQLVEYFHAGFGHFFVTHLIDEITKLDNGTFAGWSRTGFTMNAWASPVANSSPVCRFFSATFAPKSSHFYTSFPTECQAVKTDATWSFEGEVFHVALPSVSGSCPAGTQAVYRLYNNGASGAPNHRFTTDADLRLLMLAAGWSPEGTGEGVTMCAPL